GRARWRAAAGGTQRAARRHRGSGRRSRRRRRARKGFRDRAAAQTWARSQRAAAGTRSCNHKPPHTL
ncbi:hypothetical protein MNEG_16245, partial [Monoraphidium neglectum]